MPYSVRIDETGPWLVIDCEGAIDSAQLVAAREDAAALNVDGQLRDFILDFRNVTSFVLTPEAVEQVREIDHFRAPFLNRGRCALVVRREMVELGALYLAAVSVVNLEFRPFRSRAAAEAWLRGELPDAPPAVPKRR